MIEDVYALLDDERGRRPAALVLDEFQAITRHGTHLPDLLKGLADEHPKVALVVAGSQQHLMEEVVSSRQAPLCGIAERLALGPIPYEEMVAFLETSAEAAGKPMRDGGVRQDRGARRACAQRHPTALVGDLQPRVERDRARGGGRPRLRRGRPARVERLR